MINKAHPRQARRRFEDSEGLRALLTRLHAAGSGAWRDDPEAAALMRHAAGRYAALARKHGLDPWEAAAAAFDAMRNPSTRRAEDPWAMVTRAVQITCIAEERANGLLCAVHQARRPQYSVFHDAERFSDRENPLPDYHPAFHTDPAADAFGEDEAAPPRAPGEGATSVGSAIDDTIALLRLLGWPAETARTGVEYVCARLTESTSRASAFEALRRDRQARVLLDMTTESWSGLLRVVLGVPDPDLAHTAAGRGVLLRLLIGEPLRILLGDDDLVLAVTLAAPRTLGGERDG
ncbi:hypothetical protein [Rathayibacter soli]|uniref:hypothetical protein n=1 Tax=Rathayibacter soli TaxID=3144168 RepID=UPI0027E50F75|nr:hypothetical protein [Glaciibacter superstes]